MSTAERADALLRRVIVPLVLGGPVLPDRPIGARLALEIGVNQRITDNEVRVALDTARLRLARSILPVDALPELQPAEWAIAAALNDLVQVTNHELSNFATRGRHHELLAACVHLCALIPACATLEEAVCRHATFSRALQVSRTDTRVSWWTGSASFRGQDPPSRLRSWPGLRRVHVDKRQVPLADMADGIPVDPMEWLEALAGWLSLSPLSDLAQCARAAPAFSWSRHTVAVVANVPGQNLALRAIAHATALERSAIARAVAALTQAAAELPSGTSPQTIALSFVEELRTAVETWAAEVA
jgi:hypothetical protein